MVNTPNLGISATNTPKLGVPTNTPKLGVFILLWGWPKREYSRF
jgi:hypothetical protein